MREIAAAAGLRSSASVHAALHRPPPPADAPVPVPPRPRPLGKVEWAAAADGAVVVVATPAPAGRHGRVEMDTSRGRAP